MAKKFVDAAVITEQEAMTLEDGSALTLTPTAWSATPTRSVTATCGKESTAPDPGTRTRGSGPSNFGGSRHDQHHAHHRPRASAGGRD